MCLDTVTESKFSNRPINECMNKWNQEAQLECFTSLQLAIHVILVILYHLWLKDFLRWFFCCGIGTHLLTRVCLNSLGKVEGESLLHSSTQGQAKGTSGVSWVRVSLKALVQGGRDKCPASAEKSKGCGKWDHSVVMFKVLFGDVMCKSWGCTDPRQEPKMF